jgi:uncharacterized protein YprB with RNaseH-like and TPR domain
MPGWVQVSPYFWMRHLDSVMSPVAPGLKVDATPFSARLKGVQLSLSGMRFFDLETTGLSGGTGTVAFLATVGRFSSQALSSADDDSAAIDKSGTIDRFCTTQYFIDDYPGEPAMIQRLAADISEAQALVTYNGGSFDLPLFRTRCIMCGLQPPEISRHLDLLTVARRLWRVVLPDCSLGTVERRILSIDRGPDLPGSAIPERWFSYLRGGEEAQEALELVFSHNDHDVRTLASLLLLLADGFGKSRVYLADPVGLAVILGRSSPELALRTLESAVAEGEPRALKPLMRSYWKAGRRQDRMDLVPRLPEDSYGLYMKSVRAEKLEKDLDAAFGFVDQALAQASGSIALRLEKRRKRLESLLMEKQPAN